ncbi:MAG: selenocysteine-specific translation elongation factor [Dehalococcoidia bacterium]|nr:selenocysteine-specific translation elongation factor [Dehalococcoidia bacterium]
MTVIGTAGHVDHGKSALVRALSGIDPDRLPEERARGMTIDLGFAWMTLPSGREVSIVDVPGHERFIKNMMAGAGGIDLALLVVAADEGLRAQTEEHLAVIALLDVRHMVVAVTRADLAEAGRVAEVRAAVGDRLAATRFAGCPVIATSAVSGAGLDELREALDRALDAVPQRPDFGRARLPVDRVFHVKGFGTVVTGTLVDGELRVGDAVELQPGGTRARVRGLQQHARQVDTVRPGERAAVNLGGVELEGVRRGSVVARPGAVRVAQSLVTRLTAASTMTAPLKHDAGVTILVGTAERQARLLLLEAKQFEPGTVAWAELLLAEPVAVAEGDRCLVRTTNDTVAGGPVVAVDLPRGRRTAGRSIERLAALVDGTGEERVAALVAAEPAPMGDIAGRLRLEGAGEDAVARAEAAGTARRYGEVVYGTAWLAGQAAQLAAAARDLLARDRAYAVPREQMMAAAQVSPEWADAVVAFAIETGALEGRGGQGFVPAGHQSGLSEREQREVERFLAQLSTTGFSPEVEANPLPPRLVRYLVDAGLVEDLRGGVMLSPAACGVLTAAVVARIEREGTVTLAQVRDQFGTTRKYAQALLDHLDSHGVTRRVGDARQLGPRPRAHRPKG